MAEQLLVVIFYAEQVGYLTPEFASTAPELTSDGDYQMVGTGCILFNLIVAHGIFLFFATNLGKKYNYVKLSAKNLSGFI